MRRRRFWAWMEQGVGCAGAGATQFQRDWSPRVTGCGFEERVFKGFPSQRCKRRDESCIEICSFDCTCRNLQYRYAGVSQDGGEDSPP